MSTQTITPEDLALHAQWPADQTTGVRIVRINADLRGANLLDANLRGANLLDANLRGADLRDANLRGANLQDANLRGANLQGANLRGANLLDADLRDANLQGANLRGANLLGADLRGADLLGANPLGANLQGAGGLPIAEDAPNRLLAAARAALQPGALKMGDWHTCDTTHCLGGWAVHQAGEVGRVLEAAVGNHMAGLYLLGIEAATHFYDSNEKAKEYLHSVLAAAPQPPHGGEVQP